MTQLQFDTICEVLKEGAPALAPKLISALTNLVQAYQSMAKRLQELEKETNENKGE